MEVKKNRLTLLKKLNVTKSGLVKTLAGIFCIAAFTYLCYFVISNRLNSTGDTQGQNKNVYVNKGTAYEGKDINKEDPEAVNMYCQDLREMRTDVLQGEQAFDDICVMDSIAREWIPTASEEHLQYLIDDHPECFSQEYNNMGYHCFTGFDKSGCNSDNVDEQGNQCTPLNAKEKKQVGGFDASNFLANNQAQLCSLVANCDVTTNDVENKPQDLPYGEPLNDAFYNKHQCHVDGFNLQGEICDLNKIPRKFDSNTGLDQFELNLEGYNASLCNLKGLNSKGKRCDLADIPRIYRNNKDQFGLYPNGKNEFNCDLKGRKPNGDLCSLESIPKIYDDENKDQFGVYLNGENENGCNLNHRKSDGTLCKLSERTQIFGNDSFDQQNLDVKGFNPQGCSLEGINRVGERCDLKDIPRVYEGEPPRDQFNLSPEGFSITTGCNLKGFKIDGSKCTHEETPKIYSGEPPRDQFNINKSGFNEFNCGLDGKKPDGTVCAPDQLTHWFDPNSGVDQFQLNEKGYSVSTGCNLSGYNTDGNRCEYDDIPKIYGEDNFNQLLLDKDARNKSGCGLNGKYQNGQICIEEDIVKQYGSDNFDVFHKDPNGLSRLALDDSLFNEANCNVDGLDRNGEICDLSDIPLLINPITGADQFGVLPSGFNEFGCSLAGVDESGKQCPLENIPFIYSKDGVNQLGLTAQEVADSLMVKQLKPLLGEGGEQLFLGDEPISINEFGEVVGSDGQPLLGEDGQPLTFDNESGEIINATGKPVNLNLADGSVGKLKFIGVKPLETRSGEQLFVDGKSAFSRPDGLVVDADGNPLLSDEGEALFLDKVTGQLTTKSGKNYLAELQDGEKQAVAPINMKELVGKGGQPLYINGKKAYRREDGVIVDEKGNLITDSDGSALTITKGKLTKLSGKATNAIASLRSGNPYTSEILTSEDGQLFNEKNLVRLNENGDVVDIDGLPVFDSALASTKLKPLKSKQGEQLFIDGKRAYIKSDGSLVDKDGQPLLSESGEPLTYDPMTGQITTQSGKSYLPKTVAGIPTTAAPDDRQPILAANGEQLYVNGQQAFRKSDGSLVDKDGQPLLSEKGETLTYDPMTGQITTRNGQPYLAKTSTGVPTAALPEGIKALLTASGEQLYVNGQQTFRKPDGSLVDKNGLPLLSESGEKLFYDPVTGALNTQRGRTYLARTATGIPTSAISDVVKPLLTASGEQLYVNGQQAFRKPDGSLVDKNGQPLLSENGEALTYDPMTGQITTQSGKSYLPKTAAGIPTLAAVDDIKPLLAANGEPLYVNGQQAFRKPDGSLVDKNGQPLLSEKGEALTYDPMTGQLTTQSGKSYLPKTVAGILTSATPDDRQPLLATNGEPLYVNGQQAFRKSDGSLVDKDGHPLLSEKGEALTYDPMTGQITTRNGQPYLAKTSTGVPTAALPEGIKPLLTASGEQLYVNGQQAFRKPDGSLVDKNGLPLLSEKGEALTYDPMTGQITTRNGQSYLAKTSTGVPTAASPDDVKPLLATNGEPLYVNGQQAFRKPDGSLVDKNGQPLLSENGEALTYDPMTGQITTRNGQPYLAKTSTGVPTAASADDGKPLLAATGEPLYVNGQQAFRKPDGSLVDKNGLPLLSENGEKLIYDPVTGQITTQNGESYLPKTISGVLTSAAPDGITPLFSDVGEKLYVNGVQAFRKADGSLVNNLGENLLSDENEKIYFNPLTGELTTQNGNPYLAKTISGAPKRASLTNNEPLLTNNGKALYIDGKQAYRRPDGTIIDAYGNPLLSPEGKKLHYDSVTGNLLDESGDLYLAQTQNGQKRKASSTEKKALTGEKGEILLINGKKAYQKDGVLVNADGDVITDKNGNPLTLTNGKVTKLDGSNADVKITNLDGELYRGLVIPLSDSKTNSLIPLLSDSGETHLTRSGVYVYLNRDAQVVNSKAEIALDVSGLNYVFEEGQLKDFDGSYSVKAKPTPIHLLYSTKAQALNFNGNSIFETADKQLLSSGSVLKDLKGNKYSLNTFGQLIDGQGRVRNKLASNNEIAGYGAYAGGLWLLTTSNNDAVFYNGKKLQVDASGRVRDELGDVVLGNGNKPLYFSSNIGVLRGEMGDPSSGLHTQKHQPVLNKNLIAGSLSYIMKVPKLISTMLDVESLYASKDGLVSDSVGNRVKGQNGNSVHYYNGLLLDDGIVIAKGLYLTRQKNPLKSNDGRGLYINGKQAFLSDNGLIVDSEGNELFDEDGSKLKYKDGSIVDENNKAIMLSDEFGGKIYEVSSNKPLRGLNGEAAYINGQKAYVNDLGHVVNSNGDPILGPDGKVLTFDGESVRDSQNRDVGLNTAWGGKIDRVTSQRTLTNEQGKEFEIIDGYNSFDCNVKGFKRDGSACSWDEITKIYDPKTGLDQFDHSKDGYNLNGCNYKNRNRSGKICDEKLITKRPILDNSNKESGGFKNIIDSTGVNPVGKRSDGLGRLGLDDEGYNEHSCNIEGLNRDGEICPFDKIPLFFNSETGKSQFGTYKNGFNDAMCNLSGRKPDGSLCDLKDVPRIYGDDMRDQFGLDPRNYNSLGCNDRGFREDGSRCEFKDITKRISENGLDQFNLLKGRNEFGCDVEGFKADGTKCSYSEIPKIRDSKTNLDQFNLDPSGVADGKCSINGIDIQGNVCDYSDIPKFFSGEPPADQFGFGEDSYNKYGCDFYGYKKDGSLCKASEITRVVSPTTGLDQFGIGANGKNAAGCDINNINKFGKECAPRNQIRFASKDKKDKFGFVNGVNEHGCDIDGLNSDGEICEFEKITKIRTVGNKDHLGYDLDTGLNENNCDFNGRKPDGTLCKLIDMTRIFDAQRKDQNGLPESGFNDAGCNLLGYTAEGEKCDITDSPRIFDEANFDQFGFNKKLTDKDGYNPAGYDENNCDRNYQDPDGNVCQRFKSRELTIEDGAYIATRKEQMDNFLKNNEVIFTTLKAAAPATGINSNIASNTKQIENIPNTSEVISQVEVTPAPNSSSLPESRFGKAAFNGLNPESGEGETPQIPLGLTVSVEIDTPVNSDYTKEVYGVIRGSELDGAVVKGAIEVPYIDDVVMPRDKFRYVFNTVIYKRKTYTIDAVSYNPFDDSGMVTASNVDYHRIQRFGGILGATLIQALDATFLDSVEEKNLQQQAEILDGTGSVAITYGDNTTRLAKNNAKIITNNINDIALKQFFRRPTITKGKSMQFIIFRKEVLNPELPMVLNDARGLHDFN
jgi:flagellar basal body rod protein FlgG